MPKVNRFWVAQVEVTATRRNVQYVNSAPCVHAVMQPHVIYSHHDTTNALSPFFADQEFESFVILMLNSANRITGAAQIARGITNQCAVYPRQIFAAALLSGASAIVVAHNHPGLSCQASEADWALINRIHQVGKLLEIPLYDSLIYTQPNSSTEPLITSMRQSSRWPSWPS